LLRPVGEGRCRQRAHRSGCRARKAGHTVRGNTFERGADRHNWNQARAGAPFKEPGGCTGRARIRSELDVQIYKRRSDGRCAATAPSAPADLATGLAHQPTAYNPVSKFAYGWGSKGGLSSNGAATAFLSRKAAFDQKNSAKRPMRATCYYGSVTAFDTVNHKVDRPRPSPRQWARTIARVQGALRGTPETAGRSASVRTRLPVLHTESRAGQAPWQRGTSRLFRRL